MEFPSIGTHCFAKDCRKLDFLPMKCDACSNIFCRDHITYESHSCEAAHKKDKVVPSCPLCGKVIPILHGQDPDVVVNRHIDTDCQSDPAKERRNIVYVNSCSKPGCRKREAVPFNCIKCHKNFCLKHRLEIDHDCGTPPAQNKAPARNIYNEVNPNGMTEDEALARALQMSLQSATNANRQAAVARQQAAARNSAQNRNNNNNTNARNNRRTENTCSMS